MEFKINEIVLYKALGKICEIIGTKEMPFKNPFGGERPKHLFEYTLKEIKTSQLFDVYEVQIEKYEA